MNDQTAPACCGFPEHQHCTKPKGHICTRNTVHHPFAPPPSKADLDRIDDEYAAKIFDYLRRNPPA